MSLLLLLGQQPANTAVTAHGHDVTASGTKNTSGSVAISHSHSTAFIQISDSFWSAPDVASVVPRSVSATFGQDVSGYATDINDPTWPIAGLQGAHSGWLKAVITRPIKVQANTDGSNYDTVLALWTWDGATTPELVVASDGVVSLDVVAGTYLIGVSENANIAFVGVMGAADWQGQGYAYVSRPANTQIGDLLIASVMTRTTATVSTPSGWTLESSHTYPSPNTVKGYIFSRVATDNEPISYTFNLSVVEAQSLLVATYRGVDTVEAINFLETDGSPYDYVPTNTISPTKPGILVAVFQSTSFNPGAFGAVSGMTEVADLQTSFIQQAMNYVNTDASGTFGPFTTTITNPDTASDYSTRGAFLLALTQSEPRNLVLNLTLGQTSGASGGLLLRGVGTTQFTSVRPFDFGGIGTATSDRPFDILNTPLFVLSFRPFDIEGPVTVTSLRPFDLGTSGMLWVSTRPFDIIDTTDGQPVNPGVYVPPPAAAIDEIQQIVVSGVISGGTFTLTFNGQTTAPIAWNASAATIQAALEALSNIAPGDVTVTGSLT